MVVSIGAFRRIVEVGWGEMKGDAVLLYSAYIAGGQDPGDIEFSNLPAATTKLGEYNFDGGVEALSYVNGVILFNIKKSKRSRPIRSSSNSMFERRRSVVRISSRRSPIGFGATFSVLAHWSKTKRIRSPR